MTFKEEMQGVDKHPDSEQYKNKQGWEMPQRCAEVGVGGGEMMEVTERETCPGMQE